MAASRIQRAPMPSRRLHLRDFNLRLGAANLQRPPNKRLEKDLGPARSARWPRPLSRYVRPTADGRANGPAGEPRWLRPPAAVEPADGTDGPAGHGSPADPLGSDEVTI
jgi:hypothetical protein